jgi:AGZA family xanthine/uracil permease-like MFS transporter
VPRPPEILDRLFQLSARGTSVRIEVAGRVPTFLAMVYIIFVQPTVLGAAGMDRGAVLVATCLASAIGTANIPCGENRRIS